MKRKGFTLIELVVVMAIIAILALLVVGAIIVARRTAIRTANNTNAQTLQTGLEAYYAKHRTYAYTGFTAGEAFGPTSTVGTASADLGVTLGGGGCSNAGGTVSSATATGYTIVVWDEDCSATDTDNRTISGP
jgi:prepilin-type N-terminal cleavage/methylation domain-containing protein